MSSTPKDPRHMTDAEIVAGLKEILDDGDLCERLASHGLSIEAAIDRLTPRTPQAIGKARQYFTAMENGYKDHSEGVPETSNPYTPGSLQAGEWIKGWKKRAYHREGLD